MKETSGVVVSVSRSESHTFSKIAVSSIELLEGLGVEGDAHCGAAVKHRSRVAQNPNQPNLRQVHLIHSELFDELGPKGFLVGPAELGENITTSGVDLLALPEGSLLKIGADAVVRLTGLRNPCRQLDVHRPGLMNAVLDRDAAGELIRLCGVMGVVVVGGSVRAGDGVAVELPPLPHCKLDRV